eukprot:TRINITY_DN10262_c0_g1_i1.p1 TRINITY_DN10262_c0_g1~~TRINITY_DN10262_c0_g1_i1.p1  ORF type:complete len:574 (+),score=62.91 TRINITY_DN10262_c0_g1_i1:71-1792(+)
MNHYKTRSSSFYSKIGIVPLEYPNSPAQLESVRTAMRHPKTGLPYEFRGIEICFKGSEMVTWIYKYFHLTNRGAAIKLCQHLAGKGIVVPVSASVANIASPMEFQDDKTLYRFPLDDFDKFLQRLPPNQISYVGSLIQSPLGVTVTTDADGSRYASGCDIISWIARRLKDIGTRLEALRLAQLLVTNSYIIPKPDQDASITLMIMDKREFYRLNKSKNLLQLEEIPTEICGACKKFTEIMYFDMPVTLACGHKFHTECLVELHVNSSGQCSSCFESVYYTATHSDTDLILPFISKVLRSNGYTLKRDINLFVDEFNERYGPHLKVNHFEGIHHVLSSARKELQEFLDKVNLSILSNMKLFEMQVEGKSKCLNTIKQCVLPRVYNHLFHLYLIHNRERNQSLSDKVKSISYVSTEDLQITPKFQLKNSIHRTHSLDAYDESNQSSQTHHVFEAYSDAISEFKRLTSCQSITDKVNCLILTRHHVHNDILRFWKNKGVKSTEDLTVDADQLILIWSYIIVHANLPHLISEIHFINDWIDEHLINGESGFCLATLQTAVGYLEKHRFETHSENRKR